MENIETDINKRWEEGMDHHPESVQAINALSQLDLYLGDDRLCIKTGGDGDNGEHMMYLLDIYFEARDKKVELKDIIDRAKPVYFEKMKKKYPGMI